jgi:hypothetical protein
LSQKDNCSYFVHLVISFLRSCKLISKPSIVPPNKHMQRAGTHKVLGRRRVSLVPSSAPRARVLTGQRAAAELSR